MILSISSAVIPPRADWIEESDFGLYINASSVCSHEPREPKDWVCFTLWLLDRLLGQALNWGGFVLVVVGGEGELANPGEPPRLCACCLCADMKGLKRWSGIQAMEFSSW